MNELTEAPLWKLLWMQKAVYMGFFAALLALIFAVAAFHNRLSRHRRTLNVIRYAILLMSFVYAGLVLKAQPSTTNVVIAVNSFKEGEFPLELFMMDPFIFLSFIFMTITALLWGRGIFCGWLCPFGALSDLFNKITAKLAPGICQKKAPPRVHNLALYLKYIIMAAIIGVSFYNFMVSEYMTEIEPFKTLVLKLQRQWYYVGYFFVLLVASTIVTRAFCQYLCPLGAAIALPSLLKWLPIIKLRRYARCSTCKICRNDCTYQAIDEGGKIMDTVCMHCYDCQMNYNDPVRCPELISRTKKAASNPPSSTTIAALFIFVLLIPSLAASSTLVVDAGASGGYKTIPEAVKNAKDHDIVEVRPGRYQINEPMKITKSISLRGINNPVILAGCDFPVVIDTSEVIFEGFTIDFQGTGFSTDSTAVIVSKLSDNVTVRNNTLVNVMFGVRNLEGINLIIDNNTITGRKELEETNRGNCVTLTGSFKASVTNNIMTYCRDAIYMEVCHDSTITHNQISKSRYAIHTMWVDTGDFSYNMIYDNLVGMAIMYTKHSKINGNISVGNKTHGLLLNQTIRSEINENKLISNTKGMFIYNSVGNKLISNLIMNNNMGIHNWGGSEDNEVTKNSFINNEVQVKYVASKNQYWNNNYWSDYLGWDMAGKGTGDIPYESNTVVDHVFWRYPLSKLLFASPSLHILKVLEKQFPILSVPKIVDKRPSMVPYHANWKELIAKYAEYAPAKYYGNMEKIENMTGGM
ncbi:MAG: nitrous oxide reductase family maturation protein NosD [Candidatus Magnetominusculus sp. LBB02]|nr:nitrous oxide reductase family maturation protein NosD [Candidatus Magnetominusculus sp. LBB02]